MLGQALAHYRVTAMIGAGGMGVVYRAHDERLERDVALKVLPPGTFADEAARKRLRQEAMTLSRLNHPNIATVHDFNSQEGIDFLVMEMIPGTTLDQRITGDALPERDVLRLGMQLVEGLAAAHAEGIVHRDLKPGNVRVTPDGRVKILDFGLAMLRKPDCDERADTAALGENMVAGSPPYMAPEQLMGEPADARTDIYAAGAVLYEMATGRRPFADAHGARLIDAILHQAPVSPRELNPRLSAGLELILLKCLDKEPERRYQGARELLVDLERLSIPSAITQPKVRARRSQAGWTALAGVAVISVVAGSHAGGTRVRGAAEASAASVADIRSIAVLPLANLSGDASQEYFADGMTDALIADLGRTASVRVISRTSSMQYKQARKPLPEIARELGVQAVVEGSVVRAGERVRINAQLVHAGSDRRLWGDSYERSLSDVLALQDEVASAIARQVNASLSRQQEQHRPVKPEAHEAYLRGLHFFNEAKPASWRKAMAYFEEAVAKDPGHALAHAAIAGTRYLMQVEQVDGFRDQPVRAFQGIEAAARRAMEADPQLAEPYCALGMANLGLTWDWPAAERGFRRGLELNPNLAECHEQYAWYLCAQGRLEEALSEMKRAQELDPLSLLASTGVAGVFLYRRQADNALPYYSRVLELSPGFVPAHYGLGRLNLQSGHGPQAIAEYQKALSLSPDSPHILADLAHAYAMAGRPSDARKALARWNRLSTGAAARPEQAAHVYAALGEKDRAFSLLEQAYRGRSSGMAWLRVDPRFDPLRDDPRFRDLMRRMRLE